ncbi:hypothetical protein, partial [Clostridium drakei]
MNLFVKLKEYFQGIKMFQRTLIMTAVSLFVLINFNTVLTHAATLSFAVEDADLQYTQQSSNRTLSDGKTVTLSALPGNILGYDNSQGDGGIYVYDGGASSGVNLTISVQNGYMFDINSFNALASDTAVSYVLTYVDGSTFSSTLNGVSTSGYSTLTPDIKNVKQVVLTSVDYAIFQDFDINVKAIPTAIAEDITVDGTKNSAITSRDVLITLINDKLSQDINENTDLSSWITNLPSGLTAKAKTTALAEATAVTLTIAGTPTATSSAPMAITIPAASLKSDLRLTVATNTNAKFAVVAPAPVPSATVGNITVDGTQNSAITSRDVLITLTDDTLASNITAGDNLASWIANLPSGLTATAKSNAAAGATAVTITIAGTPTAVSSAGMIITIPAASLTSNANLTVTANTNAKFA